MKLLISTLFLLNFVGLYAKDISVLINSPDGNPLDGVTVKTWFIAIRANESPLVTKVTDSSGMVSVEGDTLFGVDFKVSKNGYYNSHLMNIPLKDCHPKVIYLPAKINPIPLYAKRLERIIIPHVNEWVGFDFEKADWVSPNGKGRVEDFRVRFNRTFKGYPVSPFFVLENELAIHQKLAEQRKQTFSREEFDLKVGLWDVTFDLAFPNPDEGFVKESQRYLTYCDLRLPHQAPPEGYVPTFAAQIVGGGKNTHAEEARTYGLFFRTRVQKDPEGKIVSANFAKMYEGIQFSRTGWLSFTYYFNPVANDRNLEFDTSKNLFPNLTMENQVRLP